METVFDILVTVDRWTMANIVERYGRASRTRSKNYLTISTYSWVFQHIDYKFFLLDTELLVHIFAYETELFYFLIIDIIVYAL